MLEIKIDFSNADFGLNSFLTFFPALEKKI